MIRWLQQEDEGEFNSRFSIMKMEMCCVSTLIAAAQILSSAPNNALRHSIAFLNL